MTFQKGNVNIANEMEMVSIGEIMPDDFLGSAFNIKIKIKKLKIENKTIKDIQINYWIFDKNGEKFEVKFN